jgi:hypothetical protein
VASKFTSKAGVVVEAHVVSAAEKSLQATLAPGVHDTLAPGDALITYGNAKRQFVVRQELFDVLFGADDASSKGKGKGGQQESATSDK